MDYLQYGEISNSEIERMFKEHPDAVIVRGPYPIAELPDGDLKRKLLPLVKEGEGHIYMVARIGMVGDWAAYYSPPNWGSVSPEGEQILGESGQMICLVNCNPVKTAEVGDKMYHTDAKALFPRVAERAIRYRS